MKIGSRGGHTKASYGAVASLDEYIEAKKVFARVSELLSPYHVIVDCTPSDNSGYGEWNIGVNICNSNNCDIFFSIHFNSTIGAKGCECCVHPSDNAIRPYANRVLSNLAALGLTNRGIKNRDDLAETASIKCPSMIIETCFVQEPDASLYRSLGVEKIARAIANGIDSRVSLSEEIKIEGVNRSMYIFSKNWYLKKYSDVAKNESYKNDPYLHYEKYGKSEGRLAIPPIPVEYCEGDYLELNQDIKGAVAKGTFSSGIDHYIQYGFCEPRKISKGESDSAMKKRVEELEIKLEQIKNILG